MGPLTSVATNLGDARGEELEAPLEEWGLGKDPVCPSTSDATNQGDAQGEDLEAPLGERAAVKAPLPSGKATSSPTNDVQGKCWGCSCLIKTRHPVIAMCSCASGVMHSPCFRALEESLGGFAPDHICAICRQKYSHASPEFIPPSNYSGTPAAHAHDEGEECTATNLGDARGKEIEPPLEERAPVEAHPFRERTLRAHLPTASTE